MPLHRAKRSDWNTVTPEKRSVLQQVAAKTHGVVTIPNLVSVFGGGVVLYGLLLLRVSPESNLLYGTVLILIGRLLDIADGYIADWTKTKSPVGEAVDATIDKIVLVAAVLVLMEQQLVPVLFGTAMFIHATYIGLISVLAKVHRYRLHPSRAGKLSVWFEWYAIASMLLSQVFTSNIFTFIFAAAAWTAFATFIILGALAAIRYTQSYYRAANTPDELSD